METKNDKVRYASPLLSNNPILYPLFATIAYPDYQKALGIIEKMVEYHKMCRLIGHPGSGKTQILLDFKNANDSKMEVFLLSPSHATKENDILREIGSQIGFYPLRGESIESSTDALITFINSRGKNIAFLIDEADNLCSRDKKVVRNIDRLEYIRYIWAKTRRFTSFIFAAPYDLEVRLQHSSESVTCSQFYRRCKIHALKGITGDAAKSLLSATEDEFHVSFSPTAKKLFLNRIAMTDRGGLGIALEALEQCMMFSLPQWPEYYKMIEMNTPREEALKLFQNAETISITEDLVQDSMELCR